MDNDFVVCDLETTGFSPKTDAIIEIGLVRISNGEITDTMQTLVNPCRPLSYKIKRLTGISDAELESAPLLPQVLPRVWDFIGDQAIAGHNVSFDLGFLAEARGAPLDNPVYDTLELARLIVPAQPNFRLGTLCQSLGIELTDAHRALDDARATAMLLVKLLEKSRQIDPELLVHLNDFLAGANSQWYHHFNGMLLDSLKAFPSGKIKDKAYWQREKTSEDYNYGLFRTDDHYPDEEEDPSQTGLDPDQLASFFQQEGALAKTIPAYEYRPQQEAMAREVADALNNDMFLLLEAGTGVGKSMAYLIPGLLWGLKNNTRVLVSTHTINLQEQLWHKDVPLLKNVIGQDFKAVLAKGSSNYLCLRRWFTVRTQHQADAGFFARIVVWLSQTTTGDRAELSIFPGEEEYWLSICGEAEYCTGRKCRFRRDCFLNKAKKEAEMADLIITNHSLMMIDVRSDNNVLPAYGPLIIDEAHHLEDVATNHLGCQVSLGAIYSWFGTAGRMLEKLKKLAPMEDRDKWKQAVNETDLARHEALEGARHFFQVFCDEGKEVHEARSRGYQSGRFNLRLATDANQTRLATDEGLALIGLLNRLVQAIQKLVNFFETWSITSDAWIEQGVEISQIGHNGRALVEDLAFILAGEHQEFVYWTDIGFDKDGEIRLCVLRAAPVNAGKVLYESLYQQKKTIVFTSATLAINGSFKHFAERTGLSLVMPERLAEASYDSPFDFDKQALLCVHKGMPVQGSVGMDRYLEELTEILKSLLLVTQGRTMVLFTSHMMLREAYYRLQDKLEESEILLLGHGIDGSRARILEEFVTSDRAALFGAASFWEGVDVPGDPLTCVVIVKLPFWAPNVPIIEARMEELEKNNRNSFREFSVPQAVVRFKQGFGRLIRNGADRGCVVILDSRIVEKRYGWQFLKSLPVRNHVRGDTALLTRKIHDFIYRSAQERPE